LIWPSIDVPDVCEEFQFEVRFCPNYSSPERDSRRWFVEYRPVIGVAGLRENGVPIFVSQYSRTLLFAAPPPNLLGRSIDGETRWQAESIESLSNHFELAAQAPLQVPAWINLPSLIKDIIDQCPDLHCDRGANIFELSDRAGLRAEFHLSRERGPEQLLLKELRLVRPNGTAVIFARLEGCSATFSKREPGRFYRFDRLSREQNRFQPATIAEAEAILSEQASMPSLRATELESGRTASESEQAVWDRLAPEDRLTAMENAEIDDCLSIFNLSSDASEKGTSSALRRLTALLTERIIEPVRIRPPRRDSPPNAHLIAVYSSRYLTGHERWRIAERFERVAAIGVPGRVRVSLFRLATERRAAVEDRIAALDLLGELGLPTLNSTAERLAERLGEETNPALQAVASSVQVRIGRPTEADFVRLRQAATDLRIALHVRQICLESLLLADGAAGLESVVREAMEAAEDGPLGMARRCLFAAGCSREGRDALATILQSREPERLFPTALYLAETGIASQDDQWHACLEAVETLSFDESTETALRVKAAEIAWFGGSDRPFRDRFVRQVLLAENSALFEPLKRQYLARRSGGQRYVAEFERLLESDDVQRRRAAANTFRWCCDVEHLSDEQQSGILRFMRRLIEDPDLQVRLVAFELCEGFRRFGKTDFADVLLPELVQMAKHERDPVSFARLVTQFGFLMGEPPTISPEYEYVNGKQRRRSAEEVQQVVVNHRVELEAMLDYWVSKHPVQK
jgi:hypothetical protein